MRGRLFLSETTFFNDEYDCFVNILKLDIFKINPTFAMQ